MTLMNDRQLLVAALGCGCVGFVLADQWQGWGVTAYLWLGMALLSWHIKALLLTRFGAPVAVLGLLALISISFSVSDDTSVLAMATLSIPVALWLLSITLAATRPTYLGFLFAPFTLIKQSYVTVISCVSSIVKSDDQPYVSQLKLIAIGVAAAVLPLLVLGSLLSASDQRFEQLLTSISIDFFIEQIGHALLIIVFGLFFLASTSVTAFTAKPFRHLQTPDGASAVPSIVAFALIVGLFALYIAVQSSYFFGGNALVIDTDNLTFSTYARQGFSALVWVALFTLPMVAWLLKRIEYCLPSQRRSLLVIAYILLTLLVVIEASAIYRMVLYVAAYGLSIQRFMASWFMLFVVSSTFCLAYAAYSKTRINWLPNTAMIWLLMVASLVVYSPSQWVAKVNLERITEQVRIDYTYLGHLSYDAWPRLVKAAQQGDGGERVCQWLNVITKPEIRGYAQYSVAYVQAVNAWPKIKQLRIQCTDN